MRIPGTKAVFVTGILLVALLAGCAKGGSSSTGPITSSSPPSGLVATPTAVVTGADGIAIDNYTLVSSARISRTVFEYTYTADVSNWGSGDADITATLSSTATNVTVVQGALDFGNVPLGATQTSTDTFTVRIDRSQAFSDDALTWTVQATPQPPTTVELIEQARQAGTIDDETALLYRVYYEFGDSRLPAQYVGRDDAAREAIAIQEAIVKFSTLSQPTQDLLRPFLLPPDDPASWYQLSEVQPAVAPVPLAIRTSPAVPMASFSPATVLPGTEDVAGGLKRIRITESNGEILVYWNNAIYPGDATTAFALAAEIDSTIWPKLTALLGAPLLAPGEALEVRLVGTRAMYINYGQEAPGILGLATGACYPLTPVVFLNRDVKADFFQTAAHEITHAIQARFPRAGSCGESSWLAEATSTWAEHFVYPGNQTEQPYAKDFMNVPASSLEDTSGLHEYGAYLWFLYMTQGDSTGTPDDNTVKVREVWDALDSFDSLHAIDHVVSGEGGLAKKWHEFALYNWNRVASGIPTIDPTAGTCSIAGSPYEYYGKWDCLRTKARESTGPAPEKVTLNGQVARTYFLPHRVNHLAAKYYHYDFSKDSSIRRIRLFHPYAGISAAGKAKVQAIVKLHDKGWQQAQDWTGFPQKTLCRDISTENFDELVIVISNSEFDDRTFVLDDDGTSGNGGSDTVQTKLQVSALGCSNWKGSVQGRYENTDPSDTVTATTDAQNVTFTLFSDTWTDTNDYQVFKVTGGSVKWTFDETQNFGITCTGSFGGTYSLENTTLDEAQLDLGVDPTSGGGELPDYYINAGMIPVSGGGSWTVSPSDYFLTCPALPGYQAPTLLVGEVGHWFSDDNEQKNNTPGLYDNTPSTGEFDGTLQASVIFVLSQDLYEKFTYSWTLKQDGTFDSDQLP